MNQITQCKECGKDVVLDASQYKGKGQHKCKDCARKDLKWDE